MIIATAGHVDHGKTLLVHALTGIDADRLPEEKKRGMTIDLGFAYIGGSADQTLGFIDVPGHERFIRNALTGLTGTDFVLFVIAADDGPMPQTLEHLAIIDLMGISNGAVALTKIDRVDEGRLAQVRDEVGRLLKPTSFAGVPCFPVSAVTGEGIPELKRHLMAHALDVAPRSGGGLFRLAVDRIFQVAGAGLVVTGTVFSGRASVGQTVQVAGKDMDVRVRGIRAQDTETETGQAGERCALNLAGPALRNSDIARGDWIVSPACAAPVSRFDARLRLAAGGESDFRHWTPVHVHVGAARATGRVAVLEGRSIPAGGQSLVQVILDQPIGAVGGDRFIVRDQSARMTLGGGHVVDIFPPRRGRAKPERLAWLQAMVLTNHRAAFEQGLEASQSGVDLERFRLNRNLTQREIDNIVLVVAARRLSVGGRELAFSDAAWGRIADTVVARLQAHDASSQGTGRVRESDILSSTGIQVEPPTAIAIARALASDGVLINDTLGVRLPEQSVSLEPADASTWSAVQAVLSEKGLSPITQSELAEQVGLAPERLRGFLKRASRLGLIVHVSKTRISTPAALVALANCAQDLADKSEGGRISVAMFRDRAGIGRNAAVEILEYFDKRTYTRRIGDNREIVKSAREAFQFAEAYRLCTHGSFG